MTIQKLFSFMGLLALSTLVLAQSAPSFEALDANKDGRISVLEAKKDSRVAARFAAADTNQDGYLDRSEFAAVAR